MRRKSTGRSLTFLSMSLTILSIGPTTLSESLTILSRSLTTLSRRSLACDGKDWVHIHSHLLFIVLVFHLHITPLCLRGRNQGHSQVLPTQLDPIHQLTGIGNRHFMHELHKCNAFVPSRLFVERHIHSGKRSCLYDNQREWN